MRTVGREEGEGEGRTQEAVKADRKSSKDGTGGGPCLLLLRGQALTCVWGRKGDSCGVVALLLYFPSPLPHLPACL